MIRKIDDFCYIYEGRKPSYKQVLSFARGLNISSNMDICWGENTLSLELGPRGFNGYGWLRDISGADIASDLNRVN